MIQMWPAPSSPPPSSALSSGSSSSGLSGSASQPLANLAPADELAEVRTRIKDLEARQEALRALMFNDPEARTGNHWIVEIKQVQTSRCDLKELRATYPAIADEFTFTVTQPRVELRALSEDGEILPRRRQT